MFIPVGERFQQMLYRMKKVNGDNWTGISPTHSVCPDDRPSGRKSRSPARPSNPMLLNASFEEELVKEFHIPGWYYKIWVRSVTGEGFPKGKRVVQFSSQDAEQRELHASGHPN